MPAGPDPTIQLADSVDAECLLIADWLQERVAQDGVAPHEMGVFVRSEAELQRATAAVAAAGMSSVILDANTETKSRPIAPSSTPSSG